MNRFLVALPLIAFTALLSLAFRWCWQIGIASLPGAPADFLELEYHARVFAFTFLIFSALGFTIAAGIFRRKTWGWVAMSWLLTAATVIAAVIRIVMPPRWVMDPNWGLVLALTIFSVLSWQHARSAP